MGECAEPSSNLILPRHPRATEFEIRRGDTVSTLDGGHLGVVESVGALDFVVREPSGGVCTVSRDDVFWSDERGVVIAHGLDEMEAIVTDSPVMPIS